MVRLDLLRQQRAWHSAMKKMHPKERAEVQAIYYSPYEISAPFYGAGALCASGGIPQFPLTVSTNAAALLGAIGGVGTSTGFGLRKHKTKAMEKFIKLYHHELSKLRSRKLSKLV